MEGHPLQEKFRGAGDMTVMSLVGSTIVLNIKKRL
jgi:hypothetical protein